MPRPLKGVRPRRRATGSAADVILDVIFEEGLLFLAVRNIGARPVFRVSVAFDRPLIGLGGTCEVSALPVFANIEILAPGREIRTLLDSSASYFGRLQPDRIAAHIGYRDERGRRHTAIVRHDLGIYRDLAYVVRLPQQSGGG
jgi:hypothetical protein